MNPNGTGPVLRDEGSEPVWETSTILRYLATRYGTDSFWPAFREHVMVSYEALRVSD
jgi:glutathione S-transferase